MSLTTFTVRCDWPGCVATQAFPAGAVPRDYLWAFEWGASSFYPLGVNHLCPEHRFKTWQELDEAREASQGPT